MPLAKYYCDYCDKEFQDTAVARRRHLQGLQHKRAKAQWYDAVRSSQSLNWIPDPQSIGKGVCNHFVRTGSCQYGDSCKYYHPVPNINTQGIEGANIMNIQPSGVPGSLEASLPGVLFGNQTLGNLPPSLWPPPEGGYLQIPFVDWG